MTGCRAVGFIFSLESLKSYEHGDVVTFLRCKRNRRVVSPTLVILAKAGIQLEELLFVDKNG